jgi:hypothetical protein
MPLLFSLKRHEGHAVDHYPKLSVSNQDYPTYENQCQFSVLNYSFHIIFLSTGQFVSGIERLSE